MRILSLFCALCLVFATFCDSAPPNRSSTREEPLEEESLEKMTPHEQKVHLYRQMRESGDDTESSKTSSTVRARQARRDALKDHIETLLNIKGKTMPSAKEELGSVFDSAKNLDRTDFFSSLHRTREHNNNNNNKNEEEVLSNDDVIELEKIAEVDPEDEGLDDEEEEAYSDFTEKLQSFYPECSIPQRVERLLPAAHNLNHFFFRVEQTIPKPNHHINFLAGNFKIFQNEEREEFSQNLTEEREEKLRITISWVKRGINNKDLDYIMLDSKMVPRYHKQWIQFDILPAVQFWQKRPRKNLGLVLEVEDEDRNKIEAEKIFRVMNCSDFRVRRPFPSVLDDISDELLDLNSVSGGSGSSSVDPETTSFMTEKLNTNFYPILDVCSVEIPDGETLPEKMPLLSLDMVDKISKNLERNSSSVENNSEVNTIEDFPKLHNVHIRHRIPHTTTTTTTTAMSTQSTVDSATATATSTTTTTSEFRPAKLSDDDTLEKIEEIDFMASSQPRLMTSSGSEDSEDLFPRHVSPHHDSPRPVRPFHHLRRHRDRLGVISVPEFKPIRKRVVMSRQNLMETLQEMISRQEETLEKERHLISTEISN